MGHKELKVVLDLMVIKEPRVQAVQAVSLERKALRDRWRKRPTRTNWT